MSIGGDAYAAVNSYLAVFREATWGTMPATAATASTAIPFLSCNFKTEIASEKLDTMGFRGFIKRVPLARSVMGTLEMHLHSQESTLLIGNALGGGIASASLTGASFTHSISAGNMTDTSPTSVAFSFKKGGLVYQYVGGRVNVMKISAKAGEVAKATFDMVMKDSTIGATDIQTSLSYSSVLPFTFVNGVYRYSTTETLAATTTAQELILGFELTVNNNLKTDGDARALGTALLSVLPPTRREVELKITQRFDTTTTYNRFIQSTIGAIELVFSGQAINADSSHAMTIRLPKVYNKTGDAAITSSGDLVKTEIVFDCIMDTSTSAGKDIGITVINDVGSYTAI